MDDDVPLSFRMGKKDNDREINEWYNEEKLVDRLEFMFMSCLEWSVLNV